MEAFDSEIDSFPSCYLGLSLGVKTRAVSFWNPVCGKIHKRLATWKKGSFSKVGRLTLIKSMLSGILVYYLSLFMASSMVSSVMCVRVLKNT